MSSWRGCLRKLVSDCGLEEEWKLVGGEGQDSIPAQQDTAAGAWEPDFHFVTAILCSNYTKIL